MRSVRFHDHRLVPGDDNGYFTKLAALVAFACFVLNIQMMGEIFNMTPSDEALLPWAAYAFLLAYLCDRRLLLAAGLLCITAFIAARAGEIQGLYWLDVWPCRTDLKTESRAKGIVDNKRA